MINFSLPKINIRYLFIVLSCYLIVASLHTAHFYFYFHQPLIRAIDWSFTIWAVWFVLILSLHPVINQFLPKNPILKGLSLVFIGILIGLLHIIILISLNFLFSTNGKPFWDDVWHLFNKRWLTNLIIFGLFWLILDFKRLKSRLSNTASKPVNGSIRFEDGKKHLWLQSEKIYYLRAEGNYVEIHTANDTKLIRSTLKQMTEVLSEYNFSRVSRSSIINNDMVENYNFSNKKQLLITLKNGTHIKVGAQYQKNFESMLMS